MSRSIEVEIRADARPLMRALREAEARARRFEPRPRSLFQRIRDHVSYVLFGFALGAISAASIAGLLA